MRESIHIQQIRCERCIERLGSSLAAVKGLDKARVQMGTSSVVVEYDDAVRDQVDAAIVAAGFDIVERREIGTLV